MQNVLSYLRDASDSTLVWLDIFAVNQHGGPEGTVESRAQNKADVDAFKLVLKTADGTTYDDPRALVSTLPLDKELIVTGTFVRAARSPFAAAYGPRSSCGGRTWTRPRRFR